MPAPLYLRIIVALALFAMLLPFVYLVSLSDTLMGDYLGGPVVSPGGIIDKALVPEVSAVLTKLTDTVFTVVMGLFVVMGFLAKDGLGTTFAARCAAMFVGVAFLISAMSTVFFAFKIMIAYLNQIQFARIDFSLLQPTIDMCLLFLFLTTTLCLIFMISSFFSQTVDE